LRYRHSMHVMLALGAHTCAMLGFQVMHDLTAIPEPIEDDLGSVRNLFGLVEEVHRMILPPQPGFLHS